MKCLLVEPEYKTKYPNLALCKLATKLRSEGSDVYYCKGKEKNTLDNWNRKYDEIYITTLFTYESDIVLETIKHYQHRYPKAKIDVGGIFATLMADYVEKETGIKPFIGYSKELDMVKPDYSLITTGTKWDDFSFVFTSRGCVNKCPYCAVPILESERWINPHWKRAIDLSRKNIMIHDNNITSLSIEHFREVCNFIREHKLGVIFDNGFDCRLFNKAHLKALEGVHIISGGLRFAFDNMSEDGHIQRTLNLCIKGGISKSKITVFILFNFNDTPKEAEYRMQEVVKFGVRVYPQMYVPLNKKNRKNNFIGKHWTKELAREFRKFYLMMGYYTKWTFPAWLEKEKKYDLLKQFNGTDQVERTLIHGGYVGVDKIRLYKDTSPTISTPSGGGHLPYVLETKKAVAVRWVRTEKGKTLRRESQKKGRDDTPFGDGCREFIPSKENVAGCITGAVNKDALIGEIPHQEDKLKDDSIKMHGRIRRLTPTECVKPATIILGNKNKTIKKSYVGDVVYGNNSNSNIISSVFCRNYSGVLLNINAIGILPFMVTPNHSLLVVTNINKYHKLEFTKPHWVKASDLRIKEYGNIGDYLLIPKLLPKYNTRSMDLSSYVINRRNHIKLRETRGLPTKLILNTKLAWVIGLYVAEGSNSKCGVDFSLHKDEISLRDRLCKTLSGIGFNFYERVVNSVRIISFYSAPLSRFLEDWCGKLAHNKKIPEKILLHHDIEIVKSFLDGYIAGDGYERKGGQGHSTKVGCRTVSKVLVMQIQLLLARLNFLGCIHTTQPSGYILGRKVNAKLSYGLEYCNGYKYNKRHKNLDNYLAVPVKAVTEEKYDGEVSNIETSDNTYLVSNIVVHNCERLQGFPDGHTDGHSDTQRYKQLGNAVTVDVIEALGRSFLATESLASFDMKKKKKIRMFLNEWL